MAIIGEKLTKLLVDKFNEEYQATHQYTEFILVQIPISESYKFAFEAKASIGTSTIRFRAYFQITDCTRLATFKLNSLDDTIPAEDYCFTTKGCISVDAITDNGNYREVLPYEGSGNIDPTNVCMTVKVMLGLEEW